MPNAKTLLYDLQLDEISFCDVPANQEATISLFKRADPKLTLEQRMDRMERRIRRMLKKPKAKPKTKPDMANRGKPTADLPEEPKKTHAERITEFDKLLADSASQ